jgi:hypothetical protein
LTITDPEGADTDTSTGTLIVPRDGSTIPVTGGVNTQVTTELVTPQATEFPKEEEVSDTLPVALRY